MGAGWARGARFEGRGAYRWVQAGTRVPAEPLESPRDAIPSALRARDGALSGSGRSTISLGSPERNLLAPAAW